MKSDDINKETIIIGSEYLCESMVSNIKGFDINLGSENRGIKQTLKYTERISMVSV